MIDNSITIVFDDLQVKQHLERVIQERTGFSLEQFFTQTAQDIVRDSPNVSVLLGESADMNAYLDSFADQRVLDSFEWYLYENDAAKGSELFKLLDRALDPYDLELDRELEIFYAQYQKDCAQRKAQTVSRLRFFSFICCFLLTINEERTNNDENFYP